MVGRGVRLHLQFTQNYNLRLTMAYYLLIDLTSYIYYIYLITALVSVSSGQTQILHWCE